MLPYQINPMNDFYLRQAAQYQQPYQQQLNFQPAIHSCWVTSIDEAKAARSDDFLATNIFVDSSTGKIYMKRMDNNGKPQFLTYVIEEGIQPQDPITEINSRLAKIENYLGGINDKSISSDERFKKSTGFYESTIAEQDESDGTEQSTGFSKNAGNDKWKKRI